MDCNSILVWYKNVAASKTQIYQLALLDMRLQHGSPGLTSSVGRLGPRGGSGEGGKKESISCLFSFQRPPCFPWLTAPPPPYQHLASTDTRTTPHTSSSHITSPFLMTASSAHEDPETTLPLTPQIVQHRLPSQVLNLTASAEALLP